jgi:farnesyl-diphosphate farnesyltransferase
LERDGFRLLGTQQDYNDYCYIVAGTVGHLATELVIQHYGLPHKVATSLIARAEACGRGLQKTNIVKDFPEDLGRGVSYLPDEWLRSVDYTPLDLQGAPTAWKVNVIADVLEELDEAAHYVTTIPQGATGYRQASLLCLFPAYQTLLLAARQHADLFTPRHRIKISHQTMATCMQDAFQLSKDDAGILHYSRQLQSAIRLALEKPSEKVNA